MSFLNKIIIGGACFIAIALLLSYLVDFLIFVLILIVAFKLIMMIGNKKKKKVKNEE
jgi:hypothetical protein